MTDVFTKYALVKPLKDKIGNIVFKAFIKMGNESSHKPNNLQVDQGRVLLNKHMSRNEWLKNNNIFRYSTRN